MALDIPAVTQRLAREATAEFKRLIGNPRFEGDPELSPVAAEVAYSAFTDNLSGEALRSFIYDVLNRFPTEGKTIAKFLSLPESQQRSVLAVYDRHLGTQPATRRFYAEVFGPEALERAPGETGDRTFQQAVEIGADGNPVAHLKITASGSTGGPYALATTFPVSSATVTFDGLGNVKSITREHYVRNPR